jgi:hypothetical protein
MPSDPKTFRIVVIVIGVVVIAVTIANGFAMYERDQRHQALKAQFDALQVQIEKTRQEIERTKKSMDQRK